MANSQFLKIFKERGFFHQATDEKALDELLNSQKITAYIGFDCTADSLHVGSLMQIMVLRLLKNTGHRPVILFGGATTKIGDPTGKDSSRPSISDAKIAENTAGILRVFKQFGLGDLPIVNNADWDNEFRLNIIELSEHFSVNRMLTFDSVKLRLERQGHLSLKEFLYMVMQAYDFAYLAKDEKLGGKNCRLQIGGSDQWGNIVNGVELYRRMYQDSGLSLFGLTTPLITTASGAKMGKTESGAIWLSADKLSPYDYWQFWRNVEDADVGRFLRIFTDLPINEINNLEKLQGADINQAKIVLATEATKICHGAEAAEHAKNTAQNVFEKGTIGEDLPVFTFTKDELAQGIAAFKILQMTNLVSSGSEAKNLIRSGAAKVNDAKIEDINQIIDQKSLQDGVIKLSLGKKKHVIVKVGA